MKEQPEAGSPYPGVATGRITGSVAVVGGGRWGRVLAGTLISENLAARVVLITEYGRRRCAQWLSNQPPQQRDRLSLAGPDEVARRFDAALVATRPSTHRHWAELLLSAGTPVLVEKPFVTEQQAERTLIDLATSKGIELAVNHEFLLAPWAIELADVLATGPPPTHVTFCWHETRYSHHHGQVRRMDLTVSTVEDLFPHVLSILTAVFGPRPLAIRTASPRATGSGFVSDLRWGGLPVRCEVLRDAPSRARRIIIERTPADPLRVAWSAEPAELESASAISLLGRGRPAALVCALRSFLTSVGHGGRSLSPLAADRAHPIFEGTRAMERAVHERTFIEAQSAHPDVTSAMMTKVAEPLEALGLVDHAHDWTAVRHRTEQALRVSRQLSRAPFTTLDGLAEVTSTDQRMLEAVVALLRQVPELRNTVIDGPAAKYWQNTVLPMEQAGVFDDVLAGRPRFPYRIGLYPGPTCMFRCSFCARQTGVRYDAAGVPESADLLSAIVDEAPGDDPANFYISGGLEPLTNPRLGVLAQRIARRGMQALCYTNGFALTSQALQRQPGLWDLHSLRISLYGVTEDEYQSVTSRTGAYQRVKTNAANYLRTRAAVDAPTRLGFNYVILPGMARKLIQVVEYIAQLNRSAPERPVDFLTVREDYSGREQGRLSERDRHELVEAMEEAEHIARSQAPSLEIDYGYALHGIRRGSGIALPRVTPALMRPTAHPQASVVVDLLGDVYLYREAGFPGLPGADRYVIGRVTRDRSMHDVVRDFVAEEREITPMSGDQYYLDAFDQVVSARLRQLEADTAAGWGALRGTIR
jgi:dTDP-4-amino-4,6-dideoxy-D-glucose ammonia-lyase